MQEETKTPINVFEQGEKLLETVIDGETTPDNLENHHYGAMLVSSATITGRVYDTLSQIYVDRAMKLLNRSCDVLKKYIKSTQSDIASLFLKFQEDRLQQLTEYAR